MDFASTNKADHRTRWNGIVVKSSVVPNDYAVFMMGLD